MLGTFPCGNFPRVLSHVATSQGYFPMWQLPKCAISQAATPILSPALGSHCILRRLRRPNLTFWIGKLPLGKLSLVKSHLGKCVWKIPNNTRKDTYWEDQEKDWVHDQLSNWDLYIHFFILCSFFNVLGWPKSGNTSGKPKKKGNESLSENLVF